MAILLLRPAIARQQQLFHVIGHRVRGRRRRRVQFPERDAAVLVLGGHLFPLLNAGHAGAAHRLERVRNGLTGHHIADLNERHRDQTGPAQATDGLGDEPFGIGLGNDDNGLAGGGFELVRALGMEVVQYDTIDHGAALAGGHPGGGRGGARALAAGRRVGQGAVGEAGVVRLMVARGGLVGGAAVALVLADNLEEGHGDEAAGVGDQRIAGLVPIGVVLATDYVEEVALSKGQFLVVAGLGLVVVQGFDDLAGWSPGREGGAMVSDRLWSVSWPRERPGFRGCRSSPPSWEGESQWQISG